MIHDTQRVDAILANVTAGLQALSDIEGQVKDPGFLDQLKLPRNWFGDVESLYLRQLETGERTPAEEARWLDFAEHHLALTNELLKNKKGLFEKYGPNIQVVG